MKKAYPVISALLIFSFGMLLRFSFSLSGHAAWSNLVSSVNASPWELFKPFALSYISMMPISLSVLRPHLLRFVCDSISGLIVLCAFILISGSISSALGAVEAVYGICAITGTAAAVFVQFFLYSRKTRTELFAVPLMIFLCCMFFMLLFLSFYPPQLFVFFDSGAGKYGRSLCFDVPEEYRKLFITMFM